MGRYFVVLDGMNSGILYVIAEVVREPSDDGGDREMSLAGNLAGARAIIVTEEELRDVPGGRLALDHWRSGNDNSFALDTLAHDFDIAQVQGALERFPALSVDEARLLVEHSRRRSREMLEESDVVRERSRVIRQSLKETLARVQAQRSKTAVLLDEIGSQMSDKARPARRRHLRSVS
jgi:hypothetical protein